MCLMDALGLSLVHPYASFLDNISTDSCVPCSFWFSFDNKVLIRYACFMSVLRCFGSITGGSFFIIKCGSVVAAF